MGTSAVKLAFCLLAGVLYQVSPAWAQRPGLIVVEDRGGDSALPYYKVFENAGKMPSGASRQAVPPALPIYQVAGKTKLRTMPQTESGMPQPEPPRQFGR
ncbi:MAG: hypothetical protein FWG52_09455 [Proteobacteria bacterium]|nr:hypothetical protein [Pseudomonadota bacterium]